MLGRVTGDKTVDRLLGMALGHHYDVIVVDAAFGDDHHRVGVELGPGMMALFRSCTDKLAQTPKVIYNAAPVQPRNNR